MLAQVVVDRFDTPGMDQSVALPPPGPGPVSATAAADVHWGSRELAIAGLVGAGGASEAGVNIGGSGVAELVNSVASRAEVSLRYDKPPGLSSLELGGSRFFTIEYVVDTATEFTIYLEDGSGAAASSQLIALPGSGLLAWPENALAFAGVAEAELIMLRIVPGLGGDVQVDNFILVPEPTLAAAIMALGLAGLGMTRRLSRRGPTP